jgi:propionate CoA-transferase
VLQPGSVRKLVADVQQTTFSGANALRRGQQVVYVTERAVFRLAAGGIVLTEVAPGVDLERDILARMGFAPIIPEGGPRPMPAECFRR